MENRSEVNCATCAASAFVPFPELNREAMLDCSVGR